MRVPRRIVVAFGACGLTAAALAAAGPGVDLSWSVAAGPAATGSAGQALPDVTVQPGVMHVGRAQSSPPTTADCEKAYKVACYEPAQIQQAYNLPAVYASGVTGRGATIVIVDSYGSPTIKHDLGSFDRAFGLPAPPSLRIISPAGKVPAYDPDNSHAAGDSGAADVTSGNNTVSFSQGGHQDTVRGFTARPGYDLASGVGTVNARYFVRELAFLAGH